MKPELNPPVFKSSTESVTVSVANCSPADAKFIRNVVAIFTDPIYAASLDNIRSGHSTLHYEPNGALAVYPFRK